MAETLDHIFFPLVIIMIMMSPLALAWGVILFVAIVDMSIDWIRGLFRL